jgi:glucoamylase
MRRWRITKTFATDPARSAVLVDVRFQSLTGRPYRLYVLADPALSNTGDDDRGARRDDALVAYDATNASAVAASPALRAGSSGYMGSSDGWTICATTIASTGATMRPGRATWSRWPRRR